MYLSGGQGSDLRDRSRPWFALSWFAIWGAFQIFAVVQVRMGTWRRPSAFSEAPYLALVFPDSWFIGLYVITVILLARQSLLGYITGLVGGGGAAYALLYLLRLANFAGFPNVIADTTFLVFNFAAVLQLAIRLLKQRHHLERATKRT